MATSLLPVIGKPAPDFTLPSTTGENISLRQFKGKKTVILYFYPKDETPGCTREACDFRDHSADFEATGTIVLGVSTDSLESHQHFKDKNHLPFPLLADVDQKVCHTYDVLGLFGANTRRVTYAVGRNGRIAGVAKATLRMQTHDALLRRVLARRA